MPRLLVSFAVLCLVLAAPLARAEQPPPGTATGPCAADAKRLCADADPGHGAIMRCLQQHEADLSTACKERIAAVRDKMHEHAAALHAACGSDAERLCPGLEAGTGLVKCLYDHEQDITQPCRDAMRERGPER
ncbi:MAG TPA: cysteine rich repeat-containing protein [Myxococcota bacterium]|nr:cysteine rich repeat-containing protein [Myxococcota bacterium]